MEKPIVKFGGATSSIELYENCVVIKPSMLKKFSGAIQTIPIDSIVTASIVKHFLQTPYIQIVTPGMVQDKRDGERGADANCVLIQPGNMKKAEEIRDYIISRRSSAESAATSESVASQLEKLAQLKDKKIITEKEFQAEKSKLLK